MTFFKNISYLIFETGKVGEWRDYFTDFLGMEVNDQPDGSLKVRMDEQAYRFIVRQGPGEDLWAAGFQLAGRDELETFKRHLEARGINYVQGTEAEIASREVEDMVWLPIPKGCASKPSATR